MARFRANQSASQNHTCFENSQNTDLNYTATILNVTVFVINILIKASTTQTHGSALWKQHVGSYL